MKEIKSGFIGKKSTIYEFELADLAKLREIVSESWPREGYLLQKAGKTYMIDKSLMIKLTKEVERTLLNNESEAKEAILSENKKIVEVCTDEKNSYNSQMEVLQKLDNIEQQLVLTLNSIKHFSQKSTYDSQDSFEKSTINRYKKDSFEMLEGLKNQVAQIQENLSMNSERIYNAITNIEDRMEKITCSLSCFSGSFLQTEDMNNLSTIKDVEQSDMGALLKELYRTSCEMNKVILDTALQYVLDNSTSN